ncbi:uncharacterized protein LOC121415465 [Lytechinus variegatus]|uniref:uncharacterized protein LOC121415465 n=1 Tax=Lytechinus variegatus TaxID=7654 RepID=UPI001BB1350D|nr:uncharacterized protein LOC121415465 [Lytechinus variegatus]
MANTRISKNLVKDALKDDDVLAYIKGAIMEALDSKFDELIKRLDTQDGSILELHNRINNIESSLANLQKRHQKCEERNKWLEKQLNDQEQYSRRNCVRLFGVPEKENENTNQRVCEIAQQQLGVDLHLQDIDRSHRVPRRTDPASNERREIKPRAIIIKLTSYQHRQKLLQNRRKLKSTKMSLHEDLTKTNRSLLWEAMNASKVQGSNILAAWSTNGRIIVSVKTNNGSMKRQVNSKEDLLAIG